MFTYALGRRCTLSSPALKVPALTMLLMLTRFSAICSLLVPLQHPCINNSFTTIRVKQLKTPPHLQCSGPLMLCSPKTRHSATCMVSETKREGELVPSKRSRTVSRLCVSCSQGRFSGPTSHEASSKLTHCA